MAKAIKKEVKAVEAKKEDKISFVCSVGNNVPDENYVFSQEPGELASAPDFFVKQIGTPVQDEELVDAFHKVFSPKDEFLFYKQSRKEIYSVVVPVKFATELGSKEDSISGDCQVHAMSFIAEGSVTLDSLSTKLTKIARNLNYKK